jgi:hypothetical protein
MTLGLALALIVPLVAGYCLGGVLRTTPRSVRLSPVLRACLALGWGTGMASCLFFAWLVLAGRSGWAFCGVDIAFFSVLAGAGALVTGRPPSGAGSQAGRHARLPKVVERVLEAALVAALALGVTAFVLLSFRNPNGEWDAIAIWNLRARFLYRGGDAWAAAFHPGLIASHLDYPLLVPTAVARCWVYCGRETLAAPALLAGAFTLATLGLLVSALATLRGRTQGILAGLVVLASPRLFEWGSFQGADVPLAYFSLATVVSLVMRDRDSATAAPWTILAGMMAGFATWTKNEGLLVLAALLAARLAVVVPSRGGRAYRAEAIGFALGLAPILAVVVYFKVRFSPPNDLLADQRLGSLAAKLTDPARYALVGRAMARDIFSLGGGAIAWLAAYRLLLGGTPRRADEPGGAGAFAMLVPALVLAGYVLVYVATPRDLPWHLQWSLSRLILQLWPLAVFAVFLITATPEETLFCFSRKWSEPQAEL